RCQRIRQVGRLTPNDPREPCRPADAVCPIRDEIETRVREHRSAREPALRDACPGIGHKRIDYLLGVSPTLLWACPGNPGALNTPARRGQQRSRKSATFSLVVVTALGDLLGRLDPRRFGGAGSLRASASAA